MTVTFINDTPLRLRLSPRQAGLPGVALEPYGSCQWDDRPGDSLQCLDVVSMQGVAVFELDGSTSELHVTTRALRGPPANVSGAYQVALDVDNATNWHVDLFALDDHGVEKSRQPGVPPGEFVSCGAMPGDVWVARASFTGEILGLFIVANDRKQQFKVAETRRPDLPLLATGYPMLETIGDVRETPSRESKQYISISERKLPPLERFNTRRKVVVRAVTIAGVRVTWTKESGLLAYQGEGANDIREMVIYADELVVRAPIRLPGTNVSIFARELVFAGDGCIDTTPIAFQTTAESTNKVKIGDIEVPANAQGQPSWTATNGEPGEEAGDITLTVRSIRQDKAGPPRLIARGSKGQDAEEGGQIRPYTPGPGQSNRPPADHGKNMAPVTADQIHNFIANKFIENRVNYWRWPGGQWWPANVAMENDALNQGKVTHVKLISYDDTFGMGPVQVSWLPSGKMSPASFGPDRAAVVSHLLALTDDTRLRPGDGEHAYASGRPFNYPQFLLRQWPLARCRSAEIGRAT
jgi:hypothetical protein